MKVFPFGETGRFWRGNIHTHSTVSDGCLSPGDVCAVYRDAGYDFLSITDHFQDIYDFRIADTAAFASSSFCTIPGAELHTGFTELGHLWHILAVGLPPDFLPYVDGETGPDVAARALGTGAFVVAPHPEWYGLTEADVLSLGPIHGIEVFNATSCDHNDRPSGWYLVDILSMRGLKYFACATDDAHFKVNRYDAVRGWVCVRSAALDSVSIVKALKAGAFYSSTGPTIHDVELISGNRIRIRTSPVERIFVTGHANRVSCAYGNGLVDSVLELTPLGDSPCIRVTARDCNGGRAWSNPIWL